MAPKAESDNTEPPARLDLLRHGSVSGGECLRGWQDDPLDQTGWRQMRAAAADRPVWQRVFSSPLTRCAAFAEELAGRYKIPWETDPRWRELGFGDWEGQTVSEVYARDPVALQQFWDCPSEHPPPNGESLQLFEQRVDKAWEALNQKLKPGEHALLVTHAGVIRLLLCRILGLPTEYRYRFEVPHAALISLVLDPLQARLRLGVR